MGSLSEHLTFIYTSMMVPRHHPSLSFRDAAQCKLYKFAGDGSLFHSD